MNYRSAVVLLAVALIGNLLGVASEAQKAAAPKPATAKKAAAQPDAKAGQEKAIPGDRDVAPPRRDGTDRATRARLPGIQPSGQILLPNQWSLRPTGKHIK